MLRAIHHILGKLEEHGLLILFAVCIWQQLPDGKVDGVARLDFMLATVEG